MIGCTNLEVWNTMVDDFKMESGNVIISVIKNLICHVVAEVTDSDARKIVIEDVIGSFLAQVKKWELEHPGMKFALVQPTSRPKHKWYSEAHANMCKQFTNTIKEMKAQNIAKIDGLPGSSQVFNTDQVHLTEAAGKVFVETIISDAEAFFNQEIVELADGKAVDKTKGTGWIAERIATVEKEIEKLNK
jgi:hypothetical protein